MQPGLFDLRLHLRVLAIVYLCIVSSSSSTYLPGEKSASRKKKRTRVPYEKRTPLSTVIPTQLTKRNPETKSGKL